MKFLLTFDPLRMKISKRYPSYSYNSFSDELFLNVSCDNPHKSYILGFCNFNFFQKRHWGQWKNES